MSKIRHLGGGGSGIRTRDTVARIHALQACAFNHSATPPCASSAVSPALEGRTGLYFNGFRESRAHSQAYDAEVRRELWALSLKLAGLSDEWVPASS
jgi:hypothetical protein